MEELKNKRENEKNEMNQKESFQDKNSNDNNHNGNEMKLNANSYLNSYLNSYQNDEYSYNYYNQQSNSTLNMPEGLKYESKRAKSQMSHYFNTDNHPLTRNMATGNGLSEGSGMETIEKNGNSKEKTKRPTKKELEFWKKRKEERKKIKNKWLYE